MKKTSTPIAFLKSENRGSSRADKKDSDWKVLETAYDKNFRLAPSRKSEIIPKIFHLIWLGSPMPAAYSALAQRWQLVNPGWEVRLWTDFEAANFEMINRVAYDKAANWGTKSDILRYEILYKMGGVYIDTDFLAVAPFDDLTGYDFFSGTGHVDKVAIFNGVIGARPNNPMLKEIIDTIGASEIREDNFESIMESTGPTFFKRMVLKYVVLQNAVIFPTTFFYPFPATKRAKLRGLDLLQTEKVVRRYIRKETYCVHLWYTSWQV